MTLAEAIRLYIHAGRTAQHYPRQHTVVLDGYKVLSEVRALRYILDFLAMDLKAASKLLNVYWPSVEYVHNMEQTYLGLDTPCCVRLQYVHYDETTNSQQD